jgi:hypothetical protein
MHEVTFLGVESLVSSSNSPGDGFCGKKPYRIRNEPYDIANMEKLTFFFADDFWKTLWMTSGKIDHIALEINHMA